VFIVQLFQIYAERAIAIICRLSVCNVGGLWLYTGILQK